MKLISAALVPLFVCSAAHAQESLHLTLGRAEAIALENNYDLLSSASDLKQEAFGLAATKGLFYPTLTFSSTANSGQSDAGDDNFIDSQLLLTQTIYNKTASLAVKESALSCERAALQMQQQMIDTLYAIRNAYHALLLSRMHYAVDQMVIEIWKEECHRQERLIALGASIPLDFTQARLHLKGAKIDALNRESDIRSQEIALLTLLGLPPGTSILLEEAEMVPPSPEWLSVKREQWMKWALCHRPALKIEQLNFSVADNRVRSTQAERLPTVSAFASAGHNYIVNGFVAQPSAGVGVNLDWILYDPTNKPRTKQAKEAKAQAATSYRQSELETAAMVYDEIFTLHKANQSYVIAKEGAELAEESLRMAKKKQELGLLTSFEYRDIVESLHEAKHGVNAALFDLCNSFDALVRDVGLDLTCRSFSSIP